MEKAIYTQDDLLQALQKLIHERQRVKALESEVKHLKKGGSEFIPQSILPPASEEETLHFENELIEKNKEVELLKCAIKELGEKLKEAKKALSEQPKPEILPAPSLQTQNTQSTVLKEVNDKIVTELKQALFQAQNDIRVAKEKNRELTEDLKRQEQFRLALNFELREQNTKQQDVERIKTELNSTKAKSSELERELEVLKNEKNEFQKLSEKYRTQITELSEKVQKEKEEAQAAVMSLSAGDPLMLQKEVQYEKASKCALELELEDQKLLLREEISHKKALELKSATLSFEKEELEASLKAISSRIALQETQYHKLQQENDGVVRAYTHLQESFEHQRKELLKTELDHKEKTKELQDAQIRIEELLKILREDAEKRSDIHKQAKLLEEKLLANEKTTAEKEIELSELYVQLREQKEHTDLVEQHLARRVKECTLYEQAKEERAKEHRELQKSFTESLNKMQELTTQIHKKEQETNELKAFYEEEIDRLSQENQALYDHGQSLELELSELKNVEEKCQMLEELMGNFNQILQPKAKKPEPKKIAPQIQEEVRKNFRHDLFQ